MTALEDASIIQVSRLGISLGIALQIVSEEQSPVAS